MTYNDCIFKLNLMPAACNNDVVPFTFWEQRVFNITNTPTLPFGTIVMAHIPEQLQHALSGRSFVTISIGCAPGYKGGILLYNPTTKRTIIVRRTFKAFGADAPVSTVYTMPVEYDTFDVKIDENIDVYENLELQLVTKPKTVLPPHFCLIKSVFGPLPPPQVQPVATVRFRRPVNRFEVLAVDDAADVETEEAAVSNDVVSLLTSSDTANEEEIQHIGSDLP